MLKNETRRTAEEVEESEKTLRRAATTARSVEHTAKEEKCEAAGAFDLTQTLIY
jgi:hypothetical protein